MTLQERLINSILKFDSVGLDAGGYSLQIPTDDSLFTVDNIYALIAFFNKNGLTCHYRLITKGGVRNCIDFPGQERRGLLENKIEELLRAAPNDIVRVPSSEKPVSFINKPSPPPSSSANASPNTAVNEKPIKSGAALAPVNPKFTVNLTAKQMIANIQSIDDVMAAFACCLKCENGKPTSIDTDKRLQLLSSSKVQKFIPIEHGGSAVVLSNIPPSHPGPKLPEKLQFLSNVTVTIFNRFNLNNEKTGISIIGGMRGKSSFDAMTNNLKEKLGLFTTDDINQTNENAIKAISQLEQAQKPVFLNSMYDTSVLVNTMMPTEKFLNEQYHAGKIDETTYQYYLEALSKPGVNTPQNPNLLDTTTAKLPMINAFVVNANPAQAAELQNLKTRKSKPDRGTIYEVEHINILGYLRRFTESRYKHEPLAALLGLWNQCIANLNKSDKEKFTLFQHALVYVTKLIIEDIKNTINNVNNVQNNPEDGNAQIYRNRLRGLSPEQAISYWKRLSQINFSDIANNYFILLSNMADSFDLTAGDLKTLDSAMQEAWQQEEQNLINLYKGKPSYSPTSSSSSVNAQPKNAQHQQQVKKDIENLRTSPLSYELYTEESGVAILASDGFLHDEINYLAWENKYHTSPNTRSALTGYRYYQELTDYCNGPEDNMENLLALCLDPITGQIMDNPVQVVVAYENNLYVLVCDNSSLQKLPQGATIFNDGAGPRKRDFDELRVVKGHFDAELKSEYRKKIHPATTWALHLKSLTCVGKVVAWNDNAPTGLEALINKLLNANERQRFCEEGFLYQSLAGGLRAGRNDIYFNAREAKALISFLNVHGLNCLLTNTHQSDNDIMTWFQSEYIKFTGSSYRHHHAAGFDQFIDKIKRLASDARQTFFKDATDGVPKVENVNPPLKKINNKLYQQWRATVGADNIIGVAVGSAIDKLINIVISNRSISSVDNKNGFCCNYSGQGSEPNNDLSRAEIPTVINFFKSKAHGPVCQIGYEGCDYYSAEFLLFPNALSRNDIIKAIENFMRVDIALAANYNLPSGVKIPVTSQYTAINNNNNNNNAAPETLDQLIGKMADVEMKDLIKDMRTKAIYTASAGMGFIYQLGDANQEKIIQLMSFFNDKLKEEACQYKEVEFTDARGSCMVLVFNKISDQKMLEDKIRSALTKGNKSFSYS